jgi:Predicted membrane protein (DUF2306)
MIVSYIGGGIIVIWTTLTWLFVIYLCYGYLAHPQGGGDTWHTLPNTCCEAGQVVPIYLHIIGSVTILLLGPFQTLNFIKRTVAHKWTGVIYACGCVFTSINGLVFIALNGTVGGVMMTIPFSIAGILTLLYPSIAVYCAYRRLIPQHREWAVRTYAVASASVFYRILYFGLYQAMILIWPTLADAHTSDFRGTIDYCFSWLYFLVPLLIAELYLLLRRCIHTAKLEDVRL